MSLSGGRFIDIYYFSPISRHTLVFHPYVIENLYTNPLLYSEPREVGYKLITDTVIRMTAENKIRPFRQATQPREEVNQARQVRLTHR